MDRGAGRWRGWILLATTGVLAIGCGDATGSDPGPSDGDYAYRVPPSAGDGWQTAAASEVGLSEARLAEMVNLMRVGTLGGMHGILVVKDGKLVLEEYFRGQTFEAATPDSIIGEHVTFDRNRPHNLASVTKSITSTLLGIAIEQDLISGVDTSVYDFFPEYAQFRTPRKDSITLRHMLTMTSGLQWDESSYPYGDRRNDVTALFSLADPISFILSRSMQSSPGQEWVYSGGSTNVIGQAVRKASGMSLSDFADQHLFGPLGITEREWVVLPGNVTYASGDLKLRPRDMAKIGYLFVNNGMWQGQQIVSPNWIEDAATWFIETRNPGWGYGYQWWLYDFEVGGTTYRSVWARGWGGQMITAFPDHDLVVVQTGGNYFGNDPAEVVVKSFVLDAIQ